MDATEEVSSNFQEVEASMSETIVAETASAQEEPFVILDGIGSFAGIDFATLSVDEIKKLEFVDLETAYNFYNEYGRIKGFSIRRSKVGRCRTVGGEREIIWQMFVCSREGKRDPKHLSRSDRKMEPRPVTRCGCNARMKVHVDSSIGRWYVEHMFDQHNHEMLGARFRGLMRSHRAVKDGDMHQINAMRSAGLRVPTIFRAFANQSGGFDTVGFEVKDIYNAIERHRRAGVSDTENALRYLGQLKARDPRMFWKYSVDDQQRLHNIFWCDGSSQSDYLVFGDVIGFDATYGRNKYKCPLVIFSGVDHHMRTIVFGCAILSKEGEESYVWLLRAFLEAMKGKCPRSVITDGDLAMKSAISSVFPEAHHRLCSWHLLRNATSRVGIPRFLSKFRICLLGDLEVDEFEDLWSEMVEEFGLKQNVWVKDMYDKKQFWSNAHIRGKFFAGLKTTSRCEALNMQIGKFIHNGYNLREFIEHFQQYLEFMRRRGLVADYKSEYGEPVTKTGLEALERCAASIYTREVFRLFREVLLLASNVRVVSSKKTSVWTLFEVVMYCNGRSWNVSWNEDDDEFWCSCLRMESFGIPCVHVVGVLVSLDKVVIPKTLILQRWTKMAKQPQVNAHSRTGEIPDAAYMSLHASMLDDCRELVKLCCHFYEDYFEVKACLANERAALREKFNKRMAEAPSAVGNGGEGSQGVQDPPRARHKGCGRQILTRTGKFRRIQRCRKCGKQGHNSRRCVEGSTQPDTDASEAMGSFHTGDMSMDAEYMQEVEGTQGTVGT